MMVKIKEYFYSPYKFFYSGTNLIKILLAVFLLTFYITYYFRPHPVNTDELKLSYFLTCVVHSVIPVLLLVLLAIVISKYYDVAGKWKVKNEFLFLLILTFLVGLCNFMVRDLIYTNDRNWSINYFTEEVGNALLIGIFVATIVILINQNLTNSKIKQYQQSNLVSTGRIEFENTLSKKRQDEINKNISFEPQQFVYAKSFGNYTEIHVCLNGEVKKLLERITLCDLLETLEKVENVLRIHKSYIINLQQVESYKGNSGGIKIKLKHINETYIPVSRSNVQHFEKKINRI